MIGLAPILMVAIVAVKIIVGVQSLAFTLIFLPLIILLEALIAGLLYTCPKVRVSDEALYVNFFWYYIRVPWHELVSKRQSVLLWNISIVAAKKLTIFHRIWPGLWRISLSCFSHSPTNEWLL